MSKSSQRKIAPLAHDIASFFTTIFFLGLLAQLFYAGGKKLANSTIPIKPYITKNVVTVLVHPPSFASNWCAAYQYTGGIHENARVIIWICIVVMLDISRTAHSTM